jgi:hypothetical protein
MSLADFYYKWQNWKKICMEKVKVLCCLEIKVLKHIELNWIYQTVKPKIAEFE